MGDKEGQPLAEKGQRRSGELRPGCQEMVSTFPWAASETLHWHWGKKPENSNCPPTAPRSVSRNSAYLFMSDVASAVYGQTPSGSNWETLV